jgi:hypothetical protein
MSFFVFGAVPVHAQDAPEAKRLFALLVADTNDPRIGKDVKTDIDNMKRFLQAGFQKSPERLIITAIEDANFSQKNVMDYYRKLAVTSDDAILFYFAGHGGYRPGIGHIVQMEKPLGAKGNNLLLRSDLRHTLLEKRARLTIMLSDSCNSYPASLELRSEKDAPDWDTIRCLFLAPRGLIDINSSSEGESAYGNKNDGGFFTHSLTNALRKSFKELDGDKDGFVHWHEILPLIQEGAQQKFANYRSEALRRFKDQMLQRQTYQTVRVYSLAPVHRFGTRVVENKGDGVKVAVVHEFTPAAAAGLRPGDVLIRVGKTEIKSAADFDRAIDDSRGAVEVQVQRVNSTTVDTVRIHLAPWPKVGKES